MPSLELQDKARAARAAACKVAFISTEQKKKVLLNMPVLTN